ncbi:ribosome maturation factor RimM [Spirochaetota bacterium]|nr:ribosome maturation factor RimM [Spirochaetota bacterium]
MIEPPGSNNGYNTSLRNNGWRMIVLGKILKPKGLKGEVRIKVFTGDLELFQCYPAFVINGRRYKINYFKGAGKYLILKLATIDTIDAAKVLQGAYLTLSRAEIIKWHRSKSHSAKSHDLRSHHAKSYDAKVLAPQKTSKQTSEQEHLRPNDFFVNEQGKKDLKDGQEYIKEEQGYIEDGEKYIKDSVDERDPIFIADLIDLAAYYQCSQYNHPSALNKNDKESRSSFYNDCSKAQPPNLQSSNLQSPNLRSPNLQPSDLKTSESQTLETKNNECNRPPHSNHSFVGRITAYYEHGGSSEKGMLEVTIAEAFRRLLAVEEQKRKTFFLPCDDEYLGVIDLANHYVCLNNLHKLLVFKRLV